MSNTPLSGRALTCTIASEELNCAGWVWNPQSTYAPVVGATVCIDGFVDNMPGVKILNFSAWGYCITEQNLNEAIKINNYYEVVISNGSQTATAQNMLILEFKYKSIIDGVSDFYISGIASGNFDDFDGDA